MFKRANERKKAEEINGWVKKKENGIKKNEY